MRRSLAFLIVCAVIPLSVYADPPALVGQSAQILKKLSLEELMEIDVCTEDPFIWRAPARAREPSRW